MEKEIEHNQIIVRAKLNKPPQDPVAICDWVRELVSDIGMKILMEPRAVYYDELVGNRGLTCLVGIETSHIALHVWDEPDPAVLQLDVYTCSCLDIEKVFAKIDEFDPVEISYIVLTRDDIINVMEQRTV